jgi:hypothetical protein
MNHILSKEQGMVSYAIQLDSLAINNIEEYEGLVTHLWLAKDLIIQ